MHSTSTRRGFLTRTAVILGSAWAWPRAAHAIEPFSRPGPARMPLSLAAYSFRNYFRQASHPREEPAAEDKRIDLFDFVDFCAKQPCQGVELTSYYFPPNPDNAFLLRLRRHAFLRGLDISGTAVGNTFTHPPGEKRDEEIGLVKRWIDHAGTLGAPHIRVFAGGAPRGVEHREATKHCIGALEECCDYAGRVGVMLGLENHGGIVAESPALLDIVRQVNSPWLGINLDTGNFHTDDPYRDLETCAPYAINVQLKLEMRPRGQSTRPADLPRLVNLLRQVNYQGYVVLEYESPEDPWKVVPQQLARLAELLA